MKLKIRNKKLELLKAYLLSLLTSFLVLGVDKLMTGFSENGEWITTFKNYWYLFFLIVLLAYALGRVVCKEYNECDIEQKENKLNFSAKISPNKWRKQQYLEIPSKKPISPKHISLESLKKDLLILEEKVRRLS
ncbi:hypothetical protein [Neisseria weixii]|uniref:hypothetical protein n=1 Tax=Neisseria weixii TaxID=1853276 RepID=UPI0035A1D050